MLPAPLCGRSTLTMANVVSFKKGWMIRTSTNRQKKLTSWCNQCCGFYCLWQDIIRLDTRYSLFSKKWRVKLSARRCPLLLCSDVWSLIFDHNDDLLPFKVVSPLFDHPYNVSNCTSRKKIRKTSMDKSRERETDDDVRTTTQVHLPALLSLLHTCKTERGREKTRER